jgi:hypothetical protein
MRKKAQAVWARQKARHSESGTGGDERGSILILGMIFLVVISMTIASLANWTMNDLNNTRAFTAARNTTYSATSVANVAVQSITSGFTPPANNGECWAPASGGPTGVSQLLNDGVTVAVWCSMNQTTQVVDLYACVSTLTAGSSAGTINSAESACETASSKLRVVVYLSGTTANSWTWG